MFIRFSESIILSENLVVVFLILILRSYSSGPGYHLFLVASGWTPRRHFLTLSFSLVLSSGFYLWVFRSSPGCVSVKSLQFLPFPKVVFNLLSIFGPDIFLRELNPTILWRLSQNQTFMFTTRKDGSVLTPHFSCL